MVTTGQASLLFQPKDTQTRPATLHIVDAVFGFLEPTKGTIMVPVMVRTYHGTVSGTIGSTYTDTMVRYQWYSLVPW
jgi:hypothetical protein